MGEEVIVDEVIDGVFECELVVVVFVEGFESGVGMEYGSLLNYVECGVY